MTPLLALPQDPLAIAVLELARRTEDRLILDHSVRSFLYARLLAEHEGSTGDAAYDEGLLFAACVLHDLGLGTTAPGRARFEVEGADAAAAFLTEQGLDAESVDRVWEAVALHSSIGLADHMGLLTYLTHKGVFTDGGRFTDLPAERARPVRDAYPRPAGDSSIRDAIVRHAKRSEAAAPPFSIAADLLRADRAS